MFKIKVRDNAIELVPLEVVEKKFTAKQYAKLEKLYQAEKGKTKKVPKALINALKKGEV